MNIKEKLICELKTIIVEPENLSPDVNRNLIVVLHGYGANMRDLLALSENIGGDESILVFPNAPFEFQLSYQLSGYAWIFPPSMDPEDVPESMLDSENKLMGMIQELIESYGIKSPNVILGGFSQGAMMSALVGLANPKIFKGVFMLSGMLLGESYLASKMQANNSQAVFISHGNLDSLVPFTHCKKTIAFLEEYDYKPEFHEYSMGHELSMESIQDLARWVRCLNDD